MVWSEPSAFITYISLLPSRSEVNAIRPLVTAGADVAVGIGVPLRATAVALFSTTNGWPGSGVMTGIGVGVAVAVGVSAGTGVRLDIAMIVAATLATRVASASGVGVGIVAVHAVSSNIRAVDSTSSFMDISLILTRPRCT